MENYITWTRGFDATSSIQRKAKLEFGFITI